jgi:hypothetical protein
VQARPPRSPGAKASPTVASTHRGSAPSARTPSVPSGASVLLSSSLASPSSSPTPTSQSSSPTRVPPMPAFRRRHPHSASYTSQSVVITRVGASCVVPSVFIIYAVSPASAPPSVSPAPSPFRPESGAWEMPSVWPTDERSE